MNREDLFTLIRGFGYTTSGQTSEIVDAILDVASAAQVAVPEGIIKDAVNRFLGWKLPHNFSPDNGIQFHSPDEKQFWPIGTNLFTADEAKAMFEHCLAGIGSGGVTVKVDRNRVWIIKGVQSFMLAYEADTADELKWYADQLAGAIAAAPAPVLPAAGGDAAAVEVARESQTVATLRKSLAGWQEECNVLRDDRDTLRQRLDLQSLHQKNDVWYWQGDGSDHPESISNGMAVVIRGDQLRAILRQPSPVQGEALSQQAADPIRELIALHAEELEQNEYAYFELTRTRRTDWMAWICTNLRDDDPDRNVLATGQGSTPEEACANAIADHKRRALNKQEPTA